MKWLGEKLKYSNQASFRKRVKELVAKTSPEFNSLGWNAHFAGRIVDTRNYLTHWDPAGKAAASQGHDLYWLTQSALVLFEASVFMELGLSASEAHEALARGRTLRSLERSRSSGSG
jgi:hypothetical protein